MWEARPQRYRYDALILTRAVMPVGVAVVGKERSGSSQGSGGHGEEGFQSDLFLDVASLSQAGSERTRQASLDARLLAG